MELRAELLPPPIDEERVKEVRRRIQEIEAVLDEGGNADEMIRSFNAFTDGRFDEHTFRHYWRAVDLDDFARAASRPAPKQVEDITREEVIEIVRRAMPTSGNPDYEYYMALFDANVAMPNASGLIFYPPDYNAREHNRSDYNPTPEEIVEMALSYKPIIL